MFADVRLTSAQQQLFLALCAAHERAANDGHLFLHFDHAGRGHAMCHGGFPTFARDVMPVAEEDMIALVAAGLMRLTSVLHGTGYGVQQTPKGAQYRQWLMQQAQERAAWHG